MVVLPTGTVADDPLTSQDPPVGVGLSHWLLPQGLRCSEGKQEQAWGDGWRVVASAPALMVGVEEPAHWRGSRIFIMGGGAVLDNTSFIMNNAQLDHHRS